MEQRVEITITILINGLAASAPITMSVANGDSVVINQPVVITGVETTHNPIMVTTEPKKPPHV